MCLYGNREDILTEYYITQKEKTQQGPGEKDGAWFESTNHMNSLQLTLLLHDHTDHYCIALSHPIPFFLFPLKETPSFL